MTDDQITALACEYAEFTDLSPVDKKNVSAICECFLKFISRRFHLTDKAVVKEMYEKALKGMRQNTDFHTGDATAYHTLAHYAVCCGLKATLEDIFPEIAKEVEG